MSANDEFAEGVPMHLRPMLRRWRKGCEVCGVMNWRAKRANVFECGNCGNVFDVPVVPEPPSSREGAEG